MQQIIVISSLVITTLTYILYSIKDRSWFNVLTPQLLVQIPALYIAQLVRLNLDLGYPASIISWLYLFACYTIPTVVFALTLSYLAIPGPMQIRSRKKLLIKRSPWVFLICGVLLYLPVAIEFRADLLNPRAIYEQTRTGYGLNFFLSTLLSLIGLVLYFFKTRSTSRRFFFVALCAGLSLAHGSKSSILTLAMIWLLHWRYVDGHRVSMKHALILLSMICTGMISLFYFFSTGIEISELAGYIVGYSDYTSNALMVINDDKPALYGKLFLEDNFYSRIPRLLFSEKPKNFGSFLLAQQYYPESFDLDQGVPAFGMGVMFADFKWLTLPILCFLFCFLGILTKSYQRALVKFRHPGDFIVFCFLCSVPIFSVGVGYMLPEHLLISALITLALSIHFGLRRLLKPYIMAT